MRSHIPVHIREQKTGFVYAPWLCSTARQHGYIILTSHLALHKIRMLHRVFTGVYTKDGLRFEFINQRTLDVLSKLPVVFLLLLM